ARGGTEAGGWRPCGCGGGRSRAAMSGGMATARTIPTAVRAPSVAALDLSDARFTTTPVTGPVGPVLGPVTVVPVLVPVVAPAEAPAFGPFVPEPEPLATALPFFTVQFSGAPRCWHGPGFGAVSSRMFRPWFMVGLPQLLSWLNPMLTLPGILAFWISPPWTRFFGSGE